VWRAGFFLRRRLPRNFLMVPVLVVYAAVKPAVMQTKSGLLRTAAAVSVCLLTVRTLPLWLVLQDHRVKNFFPAQSSTPPALALLPVRKYALPTWSVRHPAAVRLTLATRTVALAGVPHQRPVCQRQQRLSCRCRWLRRMRLRRRRLPRQRLRHDRPGQRQWQLWLRCRRLGCCLVPVCCLRSNHSSRHFQLTGSRV